MRSWTIVAGFFSIIVACTGIEQVELKDHDLFDSIRLPGDDDNLYTLYLKPNHSFNSVVDVSIFQGMDSDSKIADAKKKLGHPDNSMKSSVSEYHEWFCSNGILFVGQAEAGFYSASAQDGDSWTEYELSFFPDRLMADEIFDQTVLEHLNLNEEHTYVSIDTADTKLPIAFLVLLGRRITEISWIACH